MTVMPCIRLAVACAILALAGCTETRFASPIGGGGTCQNAMKGLWIGTENDAPPKPDENTAFHIDDNCTIHVIERGAGPNGRARTTPLKAEYATVDAKTYLAVEEDPVDVLVGMKPPHGVTPIPPRSYFFARYRVRGDRMTLYPVDSVRTAKLVIDGAIDGTVDKTRNELHVYVLGSPAQMRTLVSARAIFDEAHPLALVRSRMTPEQFERPPPNVNLPGEKK